MKLSNANLALLARFNVNAEEDNNNGLEAIWFVSPKFSARAWHIVSPSRWILATEEGSKHQEFVNGTDLVTEVIKLAVRAS